MLKHPNKPRAGCNFSAISGTDANAIKWDRHGYAHLKKLAAEDSDKSFVKRTPSIEFWDDNVPHDKIKAMADYLDDVSRYQVGRLRLLLEILTICSSKLCLLKNFLKASSSDARSRR